MPAFSLMPLLKSVARITSGLAFMNGGAHSMAPYGVASFSFIVCMARRACWGVAAPLITAHTCVFI